MAGAREGPREGAGERSNAAVRPRRVLVAEKTDLHRHQSAILLEDFQNPTTEMPGRNAISSPSNWHRLRPELGRTDDHDQITAEPPYAHRDPNPFAARSTGRAPWYLAGTMPCVYARSSTGRRRGPARLFSRVIGFPPCVFCRGTDSPKLISPRSERGLPAVRKREGSRSRAA